ncbi:MAG: DNA ligase [Planctomycetes bacterium]|nr:DNA ligase [Planctomycetota bacterium]
MPDLADGESVEIQGSGSKPYVLKNVAGVYSCTCPAWRNQSGGIERRTCKHLRRLRGDASEEARLGGALPAKPVRKTADGTEADSGPPLLLAEAWDNAMDLSGWWMSEKLDGVRAYWDGRQFLSRQGNIYYAPDWFLVGLPSVPLDGELWIDRKAFQRTVSIVRRQDKNDHWKNIRYLVFDAPAAAIPFEDRMEFLKDSIRSWQNSYVKLHEHIRCLNLSHLQEELGRVEALGGEGLMLRRPGSKYEIGRSATLLKVKNFHDAEAEVISHEPGKGRHKGRLGAVVVRLPNGKEFSVGTGFSDKERENPPVVGSLITFRYQELSDGGIPRFPSYIGLRSDVQPDAKPAAQEKTSQAAQALKKRATEPQAASQPIRVSMKGTTELPKRCFEFVEGTSSKFWEVWINGNELTTHWGRIGTEGQTKSKAFATPEKAQAEYDKLVAEKLEKGYQEK